MAERLTSRRSALLRGRRRGLLIVAWLAIGAAELPTELAAQGPVYRERWGYMHLERRRAQVFTELAGRDAAVRSQVADLFAQPYTGRPFEPVAEALALLRGVEADAAFVLRTTLTAFMLPEIVDPEASNEVCRSLNASLHLPFHVDVPGKLAFSAVVHDGKGDEVARTVVAKDADLEGLRRARPVVQIPGAQLQNGTYTLTVQTVIDDVEPVATDPVLRLRFHVLRGYQRRAEAAMNATRDAHGDMPPRDRGMLLGLAAEVSRAYQGEAFPGESPAWLDLERLERALGNVADGRHVLHGMTGDLPVQLLVAEPPVAALLRVHDDNHPAAAERTARPLVVVAAGLPTYDSAATRPSAPSTGLPRSSALALPELGVDAGYDVAFLESPGGGRDYFRVLPAALAELRVIFGSEDRPIVLVAEREAATVAGLMAPRLDELVDGVLLIGSGALPGKAVDGLQDLRVGYALLAGYPGSPAIESTLRYVEQKRTDGWQRHLDAVSSARPAWPFALAGHAATIARFSTRVLAGR